MIITDSSDVDIYCERGDIRTLFDQGKLIDELEDNLGRKVDMIFTTTRVSDFFREQMNKDLIKLC